MSSPTRVVLYVAVSLDGFIAETDGGVGFLDAVEGAESDYEEFLAGVGSLVMGRRTYDQVLGWGWPYEGMPTAVVTGRPLADDAPAGVYANDGRDLSALVDDLAARAEGAIWLVGGGEVAGAFLRARPRGRAAAVRGARAARRRRAPLVAHRPPRLHPDLVR